MTSIYTALVSTWDRDGGLPYMAEMRINGNSRGKTQHATLQEAFAWAEAEMAEHASSGYLVLSDEDMRGLQYAQRQPHELAP